MNTNTPSWRLETGPEGMTKRKLTEHEQAELARTKANFVTDSYRDEHGVIRWLSNGQVPFDDLLEKVGIDLTTREDCRIARDADTAIFLQKYREAQANRTPEEIAEQQAHATAAFGPGETIVNVVTGEKFKT